MCRRLLGLLHQLDMDDRLSKDRDRWLDLEQPHLPEDLLLLTQFIIAEGREKLYVARGCANIQNADLLYVMGYHVLQYPIKQLVLQCSKGKLPLPSPFGGIFQRREPQWRTYKPTMTVY